MLRFKGAKFFRQRLVCATLSGRSISIAEIRSDDPERPGLRDYEASLLRLLEKITNGSHIEIDEAGTSLLYRPGVIVGGKLEHDCGRSRSVGFFLEPLLCLLPFGKRLSQVSLVGVTNGEADPSVDIFRAVTIRLLRRFMSAEDGELLDLQIKSRGAPPLGGGLVVLTCPVVRSLSAVQLEDEGRLVRVRGVAYTTRVSPAIAARMSDAAKALLESAGAEDVFLYTDNYKGKETGKSPGFALSLVAESTTGALLSAECCATKDGRLPEDVGTVAAQLMCEEMARGGVVDTQHQWPAFLLMALCPEDVSRIVVGQLTQYSIAGLRHIRQFFDVTFKIGKTEDGERVRLSCLGSGYRNLSKNVK